MKKLCLPLLAALFAIKAFAQIPILPDLQVYVDAVHTPQTSKYYQLEKEGFLKEAKTILTAGITAFKNNEKQRIDNMRLDKSIAVPTYAYVREAYLSAQFKEMERYFQNADAMNYLDLLAALSSAAEIAGRTQAATESFTARRNYKNASFGAKAYNDIVKERKSFTAALNKHAARHLAGDFEDSAKKERAAQVLAGLKFYFGEIEKINNPNVDAQDRQQKSLRELCLLVGNKNGIYLTAPAAAPKPPAADTAAN